MTSAVRTLCSYCGVGCGIEVQTRHDAESGIATITRVSGDKSHPTNFGRLCTKGATHAEMMAARDTRLTTALVRPGRDEEPVETPVDDAVAEVADRLRAIISEHGPDAVALYVSGQMSLEAQYLANKLAKGYLRTVHIESNSRLCMASAGTGYKQSLGADGPPGSYTDFDCAELFFVIGSNMADCHPILFLRMADRLKAGAKLIVVDPRRTTTAEKADLHLPIRPGTDLALLNGLLHLLVESRDIDHEFIAEHTEGWEAMPEFLADYPPARVAEITGLAEADIRRAAAMIADAGEWMSCWTMGLNQSTHGTWNTNAICNLHLATGAICRPGSGPMSLTGQPNAMGGREMGYMGPGLPGQRSVLSPGDREFVEQQWDLEPGTIRSDVGPGTIAMFEQMAAGYIKACWIVCTNPVVSVANRATVAAGLQAAELVVTQDVYADTATNRYADIVLPATLWAEADAVMVNSDRTLTLLAESIPPPGSARPDWELICDVAEQLGFGEAFSFKSSEEIFDEIRRFANPKTGYDLRGASYERLRQGPLQWPVPPEPAGGDTGRNPIRYLNDGVSQELHVDSNGYRPRLAFPTPSRRAVFHPRPHLPAAELPDDDYPTILNTGRLQHQWHTMTKTGRVDKLNKLNGQPFIEIHPDDAKATGIVDRQPTEVVSRRGRAVLPAVITDRVRPGNCFVPFHWNDQQGENLTINAVTSDAVDPDSLQPEFKVCAVRLRPLPIDSAPPSTHPLALALGITEAAPVLDDDEMTYLAGFLAGVPNSQAGVPVLPASAPVSRKARLWIDGMLAGAHSRAGVGGSVEDDTDGSLVIWGSQTGNAEEIAAQFATRLGGKPRLVTMNDCTLDQLTTASQAIVVTSTFGDGGPPDNASDFWDRITATDAPELPKLRYAVLGIGDRSYDNFCGYAKSVDARLAELGATRLTDCTVCEIHDEDPVVDWTERVAELMREAGGATLATSAPVGVTVTKAAGPFTRSDPIFAPLSRNVRLTPETAEKEVRQFGFDISAYDVGYSVGDSLGIWAANSSHSVQSWLSATGLDPNAAVTVDGSERSLRDALTWAYDICRVTPDLLSFVSEHCGDPSAAQILGAPRPKLDAWLTNRNGLDLVREFTVRADPAEWQTALVRLAPRQYSISTSPLVHPHEIGLTVSVVRYRGSDGSPRGGVASTFLADLPDDTRVPVFLQRSPNFRPPQDSQTPMIMVGPGTGIAPFRGFLQERRALGHTGRNWLFFGDQHRAQNFYYREELEHMVSDGLLSYLDLAFSRDQDQRIYVQHKMIDQGAEVWRWLAEGAHFYVCGDAARMAKDVDDALVKILRTHGGMSNQVAADYKREMVAEKRYVRDVY
ncbi:bifunctional nitrate reductase/sulfite reductase flavoprotein subunit alpha [Mycobacterium sp. CVI_P3]|uniref:Bifunctional nitrate reductase/sulfite reductase flavoprotein subunit alpha n=1 Tax=Mycobacterium pinniadriaticum TaxID=2994102 RepID=A0ABT3SH85_9MYCO|nr:bifunctional nitrate reductase/sulfite reductase flavoprotein subunit alpha [Mycobacterium pinniadriaticum]MCX2932502.1 bifunctional nitrate reductase/sulfite reductase flavoprotein subunit alpha [Mycobacterium pinniadriaticum]MCX2938864.1 bifunctional nitrate reductase/sulfite reductase flavoprotein subunit alpha [Mycobacterium pinniadriaticum]